MLDSYDNIENGTIVLTTQMAVNTQMAVFQYNGPSETDWVAPF